MSWIVLLIAAVLLAVLERRWAGKALERLTFRGKCDKALAEPGEVITWSSSLENNRRFPVSFARLIISFPLAAEIAEDERWKRDHCRAGMAVRYVEDRFSLRALQQCTRQIHFTLPKRGEYLLGSYRLATGDLLGISEKEIDRKKQQSVVIMPERINSEDVLQAVGGFLGDISVRRFILEDPMMTVGFLDYTGREPLKAISWTRTAAAGKLQVKQYDHTAEQNVQILLNVEGGTPEELEQCFCLARMACEELERHKVPFGFRTNGKLPGPVGNIRWMAEGLGGRRVNTILYALGRADYTCYYSFAYLVNRTLHYRRRNESYLVITPPLKGDELAVLKRLETTDGNALCVLVGKKREEA